MTMVLAIAMALAGTAVINDQGPSPILSAPPMVIPPQIVHAPAPPRDPYENFVKASAPFTPEPGVTAEFLVDWNGTALIRLRGGGRPSDMYRVSSVQAALILLADRRLEPFWPAILDWAGSDLSRLRDKRLADARVLAGMSQVQLANTVVSSASSPKVRGVMQLADELERSGSAQEAIDILRSAMDRNWSRRKSDQENWAMLALNLSGVYWRNDQREEADRLLAASIDRLGEKQPFAVNLRITRAAFLAESGRHAQAFDLVSKAEQDFLATQPRRRNDRVPGSDRQFAWIKACALSALGRNDEAGVYRELLDIVAEPRDPDFILHNNTSIRFRLAVCAKDIELAADELFRDMRKNRIGGSAFVLLQPGLWHIRARRDLIARLRNHPEFAEFLSTLFRPLPAELVPALNGWREQARAGCGLRRGACARKKPAREERTGLHRSGGGKSAAG